MKTVLRQSSTDGFQLGERLFQLSSDGRRRNADLRQMAKEGFHVDTDVSRMKKALERMKTVRGQLETVL